MRAIFSVMNRKAPGFPLQSALRIYFYAYHFCLEYDLFAGPSTFPINDYFACSVVSIHKPLCRF